MCGGANRTRLRDVLIRMKGRVLRLGGALALAVAGLVHLDLYFGGYRSAGSEPNFGRAILLNAIISGVLAVAIAARREWYVRLAGIVFAALTLTAFTYTHTEHTFLGFQGRGLDPSPQAEIVLVAEIAAILLLAATFIPAVAETDESWGTGFLGAATAVTAVAFVTLGAVWAGDDGSDATPAADAAATSVTIADFTFAPQTLTVPSGTTVTWTNADGVGHSILGDSFSSETFDGGATFSYTFDTPGEYTYACGLHPAMTGTIVVTE
jgi:plastocyanin